MEKLQVAIEQARKRREGGQGDGPASRATPAGASAKTTRKRTSPRLLPNDLMDRWSGISEIPMPSAVGDARRLVAHLPGPYAAPYDVLRTKVLTELRKNGWRRVAITSPTVGCGKTTTACNLALAIARQGELRTALFDLDLRRPAIAGVFEATATKDISSLLDGTVDFGQQAVRVGTNLAISMVRHAQNDPTRLLAGKQIGEVLDEIEKAYAPDVMIFDLPPILIADDARAFLKNVDCAILMARAEATTAKQIDICEREIAEQTNVLGVVLNQTRFDESSSDYQSYT